MPLLTVGLSVRELIDELLVCPPDAEVVNAFGYKIREVKTGQDGKVELKT